MNDLSLHILDIAQNSLMANARNIYIVIGESLAKNTLILKITDDGAGMDEETLQKVKNPFYTTRTTRKVGMGLSLLDQSAQMTGGSLMIESKKGQGTSVYVSFVLDHIDRPVIGDISSTLCVLFSNEQNAGIFFSYKTDTSDFEVDTYEIKKILGGHSIHHPKVIKMIREMIREEINNIQMIK